MNEKPITVKTVDDGTVVQVMPDGSERLRADKTDWQRLNGMTEAQVEAAAQADGDNPPLSSEELAGFKPVPNPKAIRVHLHMTQEEFARRFRVPLGTLRDWEQGARQPDSAAKSYLRVIAHNPQAVIQALEN